MRRSAGEALVRFVLFCGAFGLVRWATVTYGSWREEFSSSFEIRLDVWLGWIALLVAAGLVIGVACLPGRPVRYRIHVPLVITLPALVPLAHYAFVMEALRREWSDLPWILDHLMFYTDTGPQYAFALIAGFGLAAGFRDR
ncbi:MAG TPA: hypothetical protein VEU29_02535, partial [Actinomycetota bacterium]|nr:hypothetical protein [Actinomycetota bacterium]